MTVEPPHPAVEFRPADEQVIVDLETLKVLADPLRMRIRELLGSPCTVKQVASTLHIAATKLYYHINLLEKHGLIVMVDARVVSGMLEKQYQVAARTIRVHTGLLSGTQTRTESIEISVRTLFKDAQTDLLTSIQEGAIDLEAHAPTHRNARLSSLRLRLTDAQADALFEALDTFIRPWKNQSDANLEAQQAGTADPSAVYKLFLTAFPTSRRQTPDDV